ncbi:MAG: FAD synthetase family protein [Clostridia bacterium]|nr:FAD synthetase family protein [Clostridia bacterium]
MRILNDTMAYDAGPSACALGTFDGVHIGHQALIRRMVETAREKGLASVVCCFDRHPLEVLGIAAPPRRLLTPEEQMAKLEALGVDVVWVQTFTRDFADVEPEEYLRSLADRLQCRCLVAGENYTFGRRGMGDAALLRRFAAENGLEALIVPFVREDGEIVSSTRIRRLMETGDEAHARRLLALDDTEGQGVT